MIIISKMDVGAKIQIKTHNSLYKLEKINTENDFLIEGGSRWPKPHKVFVNGCTWGGSMIKPGVIEENMYMEIIDLECNKIIITSPIESIIVPI